MVELTLGVMKDLGLNRQVLDALPYAVVGGVWEGSLWNAGNYFDGVNPACLELCNHIVPAGHQLKILFLRVTTTDTGGATFRLKQTNPSALGQTGAVEAYPVVGSVPPFVAGSAIRDYPMLEGAGAETLRGSLIDPVHVLEGSIIFEILRTPDPATGSRYCVVWWGVQKIPE